MLRLLALAMFLLGVVLLVREAWSRTDAERKRSIGVAALAVVLVVVGLAMIVAGD